MAIHSMNHVQLTMPTGGEATIRKFYGDALGMEEIERPAGDLRQANTIWFRSGTAELHLAEEEDFQPARKGHPAMVTDDLDGLARRCESGGFPVSWDQRYPGVRRFYVKDPFGNRLELMQPGDRA